MDKIATSANKPSVRRYAPFLTPRWWLLHTVAVAAVYTIGHLLFGG